MWGDHGHRAVVRSAFCVATGGALSLGGAVTVTWVTPTVAPSR
jgi:hypothetical protein